MITEGSAGPAVKYPGELQTWLLMYERQIKLPYDVSGTLVLRRPRQFWNYVQSNNPTDKLVSDFLRSLAHAVEDPERLKRWLEDAAWAKRDREIGLPDGFSNREGTAVAHSLRYAADRLVGVNRQAAKRPKNTGDDLGVRRAKLYFAARVLRWHLVCLGRFKLAGGKRGSAVWATFTPARIGHLNRLRITGAVAPREAALTIVGSETLIAAETLRTFIKKEGRELNKYLQPCLDQHRISEARWLIKDYLRARGVDGHSLFPGIDDSPFRAVWSINHT